MQIVWIVLLALFFWAAAWEHDAVKDILHWASDAWLKLTH